MSKRPLPTTMKAPKCKECGVSFSGVNDRANGGFSALCRPCYNKIKTPWHAAYVEANKEWINAGKGKNDRERKSTYREMVYKAYGDKCACCGETIREFLTLEHRNGGGNKHRQRRGILGVLIDVIKAGYPPDYCLYCMNCNHATRDGKPCPHELERKAKLAVAAD